MPCPMLRAPLEHLHVHGETGLNSPSIHGITRHLHIRGENLHIMIQLPTESGTSPDTWRKLAETARSAHHRQLGHLHTRGENLTVITPTSFRVGISPHTRRKQNFSQTRSEIARDISAYAEKTEPFTNYLYLMREHLHVCGENTY